MNILTDTLHRIAYATDASVFREVPYGVAYPESVDDLHAVVGEAQRLGLGVIARAGGTSIAGQVVGSGIVVDVSRNLSKIIEINAEERYAWVEPGVVRDELNLACKPYGLFFSPETSTSNRCCIGGMLGNNSCGTHSLVYGSTRGHVLEADAILADNTEEHFAQYSIAQLEQRFGKRFWENEQHDSLIERIYSQLIGFALDDTTRKLIADNYPDPTLARRSCGYAIDETIEDIGNEKKPLENRTINLCRLLAGSEGTLALIYRIKVSLDVLPEQCDMVICAHCTSLNNSFAANLIALKHHPVAVELMDGDILELSKSNRDVERFFVKGDPPALLMVELRSVSKNDLDLRADALESQLIKSGYVTECTRVYGEDVSKVWNLRKAGLGVLSGMKGDAKPTGVIEDTAVAPTRLPQYMADFQKMLRELGTSCVYYGHISTGELHLRPILNLKTEQGRRLFREIARKTTLLVRKHRGTISGEHGDGRLRGEFIPLLYGDETYQLMRQVKYCWDPQALFNPGKIVDTPKMDEGLRYQPSAVTGNLSQEIGNPSYNWKAAFDECRVEGATGAATQQQALVCTVEQCNGSGDCRKSQKIGGVMCPAFKVSGDELMTTRARANVLREYLTQVQHGDIRIDEQMVMEILSSCLACKGCLRECPSGIDMTRLRSEVLQYLYDKNGTPLRTWLVAHNADLQRLGAMVPGLYNFFATNAVTSRLIKRIVGFAPERSIPKLSAVSARRSASNCHPARLRCEYLEQPVSGSHKPVTDNRSPVTTPPRRVYLFLDEFTRYQEKELFEKFVTLLVRLGYEPVVPKQVESGRAAISKGRLKQAKRYAEKNVRLLKDVVTADTPLVGIEPSCILTFRDEYADLVAPSKRKQAQQLAENCLLYDEFLMREVEAGRITADMFSDMPCEIWLHGHCHQKALVGIEKTAQLLSLPRGAKVNVIPSGCCGMAGSFGYEKQHYKTSLAIGEMVLFPAVRKAVENGKTEKPVFVAAPGTSCRTQIKDGTGVTALHPIEILLQLIIDN